MFKGHIAQLLRHPCGASVIDDLYNEATSKQQAAMAAELYGREYVLFSGEAKRLPELMKELPPAKQKAVLRNMAQHAIPIMEKALVDPPLVHRSGCTCRQLVRRHELTHQWQMQVYVQLSMTILQRLPHQLLAQRL